MENKDLLRITRYIILGIVVAIGGMFVSDIAGHIFNGLGGYGFGCILGICMYLCIVIVTCTGIVVSKIEKNSIPDKSDVETKE